MADPLKTDDEILPTVHATAVVVGETGVLITGPSGSGKSRIALDLLQAARADRQFAALVSDDQVGMTKVGSCVMAVAPRSISGMIEVRGSAIMKSTYLSRAVMHVAVAAGRPQQDMRLPAADSRFSPLPGMELPLLYMVPGHLRDPLELISALRQGRLLR